MRAHPFEIAVSDADISALRQRLRNTRLAPDLANADWGYGVERSWLSELLDYWGGTFDWRAQEAAMNRYLNYRIEIDGVPIHFMHISARTPNALPLVLTHGWPWTFWDWHAMIDPLTNPTATGGSVMDGFDLIIPSLPGFTFSSPLTRTGLTPRVIAPLWHRLMREVLGYHEYVAAGGDWGAFVTSELGQAALPGLKAVHMNLPVVPGVDVRALRREDFAADEAWMFDRMTAIAPMTQSHLMVHSRDPQTLAYALNDSPAGLAAWLWERRRNWSDCRGDVLNVFDRDFLCATASLYWHTGAIGSSMRIYADRAREGVMRGHEPVDRTAVPTGYAIAPKELLMVPRHMAEARTNLQRWAVLPRGGHFLPAECPELLVEEYRTFFGAYR